MNKNILFSLLFLVISSRFAYSQNEKSTFNDSRDGQTYDIVAVDIKLEGGITIQRTWFAENLNYETEGSVCYKNEPAYCDAFGRLYTFEAAKVACPDGWHISTSKEWKEVFDTFGGKFVCAPALREGGESGLEIKMGGFGDPGDLFVDVGVSGNFWDAESETTSTAGLITVPSNIDEVFHVQIGSNHKNHCRCVKDY